MMINQNIKKLKNCFRQYNRVIVALSGGVDSCLTVFLARKFLGKENVLAVISASPSLKQHDLRIAKAFCRALDIRLEIVHTRELENPNYIQNPINRCYFCKHTLYEELIIIAEKYPNCKILNGQNRDDLGDYRPGLKAAKQFNISQPLAECGLGKRDIRELAKHFSLSVWNKPATPCLSSRIPYGQSVTLEKLTQIESAENLLNRFGFTEVRVRHYGHIARIEVPGFQVEELKRQADRISPEIKELGFLGCEIDEEGLVSGKLNRAIK